MPFDFDELNPADASTLNAYPADERNSRLNMRDAFEIEHDEQTGFHNFQHGNAGAMAAVTAPEEGMLFFRTDTADPGIFQYISAAWTQVASKIVLGTVAMFYQNSAPDGWSFDGMLGDHLLMMTNTEMDGGGGTLGDWTFAGVTVNATIDGHAVTIAQMPAHGHTVDAALSTGAAVMARGSPGPIVSTFQTSLTGGDGTHNHTISATSLTAAGWRPQHRLVINCSKD